MKETLYDWLFHYSPYNEIWSAFRREHKEMYFNGELSEKEVIKSKKILDLVDYINKMK